MTLVITEISEFGIAMAADSAVTYGTDIKRSLSGIQKLQKIPKINAGISCWGEGEIDGIETDIWLDEFIKDRTREYNSIDKFAKLLQDELRKHIKPLVISEMMDVLGTIGFHIAGYVNYKGEQVPTCYHVHNGGSYELGKRGIIVNPEIVNSNHDFPPYIVQELIKNGENPTTWNGDILIYTMLFNKLHKFFDDLRRTSKIRIPQCCSLADRAKWLKFQIRTISELYKQSNLGPKIGGEISTLTISRDGIQSFDYINPYFKD